MSGIVLPQGWAVSSTGHVVEAGAIRRVADALEDPNPLWRSTMAAQRLGYDAELAPPSFVDAFNPFYSGEPYPAVVELPHRFSAGDEFVFHHPICAGDTLSVRCEIEGVEEKLRRDGHSRMVFVTYRKDYTRGDGTLVAQERWIMVSFDGERTASAPQPLSVPDWATEELGRQTRDITPTSIVRWTAAVGDYERTHFDYRHATEECGLPDIVGHGPYTTAMLLKVVTDTLADPGQLRDAAFRYAASVYPGDRVTFAGWRRAGTGDRQEAFLAAVKQDGTVVTTGTCTWNNNTQEST